MDLMEEILDRGGPQQVVGIVHPAVPPAAPGGGDKFSYGGYYQHSDTKTIAASASAIDCTAYTATETASAADLRTGYAEASAASGGDAGDRMFGTK